MTIQAAIFLVALCALAIAITLPQRMRRGAKNGGCGRCPRYGEGCKNCARSSAK